MPCIISLRRALALLLCACGTCSAENYVIGGLNNPNANQPQLVHDSLGRPLDPKEAAQILRRAAEKGDVTAQANLGFAYMRGLGVTADCEQAIYWCKKAARAGSATAHGNLAFLYRNGCKGSRSYLLAYKHYFICAYTANAKENYLRGRWYEREVAARNPALATLYFTFSACQGNPLALLGLIRLWWLYLLILLLIAYLFIRRLADEQASLRRECPGRLRLSSWGTASFKFGGMILWFGMLISISTLIALGAADDYYVREKFLSEGRWIYVGLSAVSVLCMAWFFPQINYIEVDSSGFHVSNYMQSTTIPFDQVSQIRVVKAVRPELICIKLNRQSPLGSSVIFMPPIRLPFDHSPHPMISQLQQLIPPTRQAG